MDKKASESIDRLMGLEKNMEKKKMDPSIKSYVEEKRFMNGIKIDHFNSMVKYCYGKA